MKNIKQQTDAPQAKTDCNQLALEFPDLISRIVVVQTNDHHVTSDAGALLLAQVDRNEKLIEDFAAGCFIDHRDPDWVEHPLKNLLRQRIYGIALGYEDVNDHESLKFDPLIATLCGVDDVEGNHRLHEADPAEREQSAGREEHAQSTGTLGAGNRRALQEDPVLPRGH